MTSIIATGLTMWFNSNTYTTVIWCMGSLTNEFYTKHYYITAMLGSYTLENLVNYNMLAIYLSKTVDTVYIAIYLYLNIATNVYSSS